MVPEVYGWVCWEGNGEMDLRILTVPWQDGQGVCSGSDDVSLSHDLERKTMEEELLLNLT